MTITTASQIEIVCNNISKFLKSKNEKYGDSAISPVQIFAKGDPSNLILIRMDDKLNRIINSNEIRKNDMIDLIGYGILFLISKGEDWINFTELID